ncbi:ring-cleaving dioxygenase [Acuticoccus sediminis]|uniref:Ring-cleaving dioxygenase n=1 Tax=Acuticoccus sediminis TaxID=2184697 RepID=A0A8B2NIU0_9HYPH|nr:ring-cleaving dioxygenase [Acuticoccus sediminis]RAH98206.1 ring-cleaving dioxygenase [Acuticoccus sediminis]
MAAIRGLHHITAISGPAQASLDYHTGTLGRRLVKTTVNFDDPSVYHLYYGAEDAGPGGIFTVFPYDHAGHGRTGTGIAESYGYAVSPETVAAFEDRGRPFERFGETGVTITDNDGAPVELVATPGGPRLEHALFHSATMVVADPDPTARLLTEVFGYEKVGQEGDRQRFASPDGPAGVIDVIASGGPRAQPGAGSIHHLAFRAADDDDLMSWQSAVRGFGLSPTPLIDRQYFHSIYFREPGGILFEIATDPPGFAVDEPQDQLGRSLKLPPQHESKRRELEATLPPLRRTVAA